MAWKLIAQDAVVNMYDGGAWDGDNTLGAAAPVQSFARRLRVEDTVSLLDNHALGDSAEKNRPNIVGGRAEVELYIVNTGVLSGFAVGNVAKIGYKPLTSLSEDTWTGIVVSNSADVSGDSPQVQTITLQVGVDGTVA